MLARSRGSAGAFADFYEAMAPSLIGYFARQSRDAHTALELMAVTIARAFEARQDFHGSSDEQAAAWLWTIARRELARFEESRSVERSALQRLGWQLPVPTDQDIREVERMIATADVRRQIEEALDTLPADQREVIELRYVEDLSDQEIAEKLNISNDLVRKRRSRGLHALRDHGHLQGALIEVFDG
jgi:RNA polymerase sigma factor (sigma-70 family)